MRSQPSMCRAEFTLPQQVAVREKFPHAYHVQLCEAKLLRLEHRKASMECRRQFAVLSGNLVVTCKIFKPTRACSKTTDFPLIFWPEIACSV